MNRRKVDPSPNTRELARRRGSALVLSLLVMVVLTILMTALLSTRVSEARAISSTVRTTNAQLIAEAGVEYVMAMIVRAGGVLSDDDDPYYDVRGDYAGGTFAAVADRDPATDRLRIVSLGSEPQGSLRRVEVLLDIQRTNQLVRDFALLTCGDLSLTGAMRISDGDVYTGGDLSVGRAEAIVNGSAMAMGTISFSGAGSVSGNVVSETGAIRLEGGNRDRIRAGGYASNPFGQMTLLPVQAAGGVNHDPGIYDMPAYCGELRKDFEIDEAAFDEFQSCAQEGGSEGCGAGSTFEGDAHVSNGSMHGYAFQRYVNGSMKIEGTPPQTEFNGVYFIDGDLTIRGNFSGSATFVVAGDLNVTGNATSLSTPVDGVDRAFIVGGNVWLAGNSRIDGVIYANGGVSAAGSATVNGSVIAMGAGKLTGSLEVQYVPPASDLILPKTSLSDLTVHRWRLVSN